MRMAFFIHSRLVWYQCVSRSTTTSYLHGLAQIERLDHDALDLEADGVAAPSRDREVELAS